MENLIKELNDLADEKGKILRRELDVLSLIKQENSFKMHAYHEIPNISNNGEELLGDLESALNIKNQKASKVVILSIELPEHHINIITPYDILSHKDCYILKCDKEDAGWLGMWSGNLENDQIIELNSSKEGKPLVKFLPTRSNFSKYLTSNHSEKISISDFIKEALNRSVAELNNVFTNGELFNGSFKYKNGKKVLLDENFTENLIEKLNLLTIKTANDIEDKKFERFEEDFDSDEMKSLVDVVYKFEAFHNKAKLDNELNINSVKRNKNKI